MKFEDIPKILERNDPSEVLKVPIMVSMYDGDQDFCEEICLKLSEHEYFQVRANSILGFGHIARRFECFKNAKIFALVNVALLDENPVVRGQADCAADDIACYLKVTLSNHSPT